jgi:hypothetical protein
MAPLTRKRKQLCGDGSPGEPQTATKAAEKSPGAAPQVSASLEASEEDEEDEEESDEEEDDHGECCKCFRQAHVNHSDMGGLCRKHEVEVALEEAEWAGTRHAKWPASPLREQQGTPAAAEQAAREQQLRRLEKRKAKGQASSSEESDGCDELSSQKVAARRQARLTLRMRYVLRRARPADVVRYLRAAVRGTDAASARAVEARAEMLPEKRWPAEVRRVAAAPLCFRLRA